MIFYTALMIFLIFFWYFLFGFEPNQRKNIYSFVAISIMIVLVGLRHSSIGNDTGGYIRVFDNIRAAPEFSLKLTRFEPGFTVIVKVITLFFQDAQAMLFIFAAFTILTIWRMIRLNSSIEWLSIFLLFSLRFCFGYMNTVRQSLAMAIVCLAYEYVKKRKLLKFIIIMLIATLFHTSAIIFFIAYPLSFLRFRLVFFLVTLGVTGGVFLVFSPVMSFFLRIMPSYFHYSETRYFDAFNLGNILHTLMIFAVLVLCVAIRHFYPKDPIADLEAKKTPFSSEFNESDTLLYMMLAAFCLAFLSIRASMLDRIQSYFWTFSILALPHAIRSVKDKSVATVVLQATVVVTFAYNLVILYLRPEWNIVVPYKFFWQ